MYIRCSRAIFSVSNRSGVARAISRKIRTGLLATLCLISPLCCPAQEGVHSIGPGIDWKRVDVRIVARGPNVTSSTGNMDYYLALVFAKGRKRPAIAARIVDDYPGFQSGLADERIASGRLIPMRLTYAAYCRVSVADFIAKEIFDQDALAKLRDAAPPNSLPCFMMHR